jgi:hypothetical protein
MLLGPLDVVVGLLVLHLVVFEGFEPEAAKLVLVLATIRAHKGDPYCDLQLALFHLQEVRF